MLMDSWMQIATRTSTPTAVTMTPGVTPSDDEIGSVSWTNTLDNAPSKRSPSHPTV